MNSRPQKTPFAESALAYFRQLYEGKNLPEGRQLLNTLQRIRFGNRRLTASEARWVAQQLTAERSAGILSALAQIITRPERAAPEADLTQPARPVSAFEALANILRTPQRALQAAVLPKGKVYGKEAGKPTVAHTWAEAFASDPTWGSVLEALWPGAPRPVRQAAGILADIVVDPLALLGALGILGRGAQAFGPTRVAKQVAERMAKSSSPSARAAAGALSRDIAILAFLDRAASENLARWLGVNPAAAAHSQSPLRPLGLALHLLLDPSATKAALREAQSAPQGQKITRAFASLAQAQELRRRVAQEAGAIAGREQTALTHAFRGIPEEAMEAARKAAADLPDDHPDAHALRRVQSAIAQHGERAGISYANASDVETVYRLAQRGGWKPPFTPSQQIARIRKQMKDEQGELSKAAEQEAERLLRLARQLPDVYDKALSLWKATKTVLNPPSFVRNFFQNFILRHLEGEPTANIPAAIARLTREPRRFKDLWQQTERAVGSIQDVGVQGLFGKTMDTMAQWYEAADRLAAVILSEATGKPPATFLMNYGEIPETLEFFRRRGLAPFISWQYFAVPAIIRGAVNAPQRARQVLQASTALQPEPAKRGQTVQVNDREIRVGNILPINPADYGGDMELLDPRNAPLIQLAISLSDIKQGKGYRPIGATDRKKGWEGLAALMKDFWLPPALGYYLPGLLDPPTAQPGKRKPRERVDYLFGLLGVPTRPIDPQADLRTAAWEQIERNRRKAEELMRLLPRDATSRP